jgi:excreted virulence factor EspC (type VII ESX diderm)
MEFQVRPEALRRLAGGYESAGESVSRAGASLSGSGRLGPDAFGLLPEGLVAHAEYSRKLEGAVNGLQRLRDSLDQFATNLDATAANYEAAERASSVQQR